MNRQQIINFEFELVFFLGPLLFREHQDPENDVTFDFSLRIRNQFVFCTLCCAWDWEWEVQNRDRTAEVKVHKARNLSYRPS